MLHDFGFIVIQIHVQLRGIFMTEAVYFQLHDDMTFQDTVIKYQVSKVIVPVYQNAFLPGFKTESVPISSRKFCRLSRIDCSRSSSVTNALSFKPRNSNVTGVFITSFGCNWVACCCTNADNAVL